MLKHTFLAQVAFAASALIATSVHAADAPMPPLFDQPPAMVPPPVVHDWTGFYLGVHGGGAWTRGDSDFVPLPSEAEWNRSAESFDLNRSSGLFGVHLGYNYQFAPMWVIGLEGDWSWTNNKASESINTRNSAGVPFVPDSPAIMSRDLDWVASIRGRLGFLATPDVLLYATGGAAFSRVNYEASLSAVPPIAEWAADFDKTKTGWVIGGGAEWQFMSNLLVRAEYLFHSIPGGSSVATADPDIFPGFTIRYRWDDFDLPSPARAEPGRVAGNLHGDQCAR
jgi:outer membrane immunogenic protein